MLLSDGFVVIPGPFAGAGLIRVIAAYATAVAIAGPEHIRSGSTSVRVNGLLNYAPDLAQIFCHEPLLAAAFAVIGGPCKLSAFHSRSLRPGVAAEPLHQDVARGKEGWPLVGFIFMVDAFGPENGATRFLPRSCDSDVAPDPVRAHLQVEQACGDAGAMIVFHGSTWHGHGANTTGAWRRSIQGALIPAGAAASVDHRSSMDEGVRSSMPSVARRLLTG